MARYDDHDRDNDRRDMRHAYGRYGGAVASDDDRHRKERWRHRGYGMDRGDYYDPDHEYRSRRYQRSSDYEEPYAERPMPGEHADRQRDRRITRQQSDEEHAWARPSAWFGGEGRHRGVGPKGYVRSDERIRELVCDDLMDDPWVDASGIEVAVKNGEVTLSGTVKTRETKRWAEDVAEHAGGVKHVQNNLRVEVAS